MQVVDSLLDLVGDTPLVRLGRFSTGVAPTLLAKVEYLNPAGSVKDRIAVSMISAAEEAGKLQRGGTIVEPTSGNTGAGLALAATLRGYRCVFVMPDKMSQEKINLLRAYGAEVVLCPAAVDPDDPRSYYRTADRLTEEMPGAFQPNQYANTANPASHERTTGPELWAQTDGQIDALVAGVGTGGTITGAGRYLKRQNPDVEVVGADPEGSVFSTPQAHPYLVEGVGEDFWPETFDPNIVDRYVTVGDRDSFLTTRRLAREEGMLLGGSSGLAAHAALEVAADYGPDATIVVLLPDSGRSYLSKIFNDEWMTTNGFLERVGSAARVFEVVQERDGALPGIIHVRADELVRDAITLLHRYGVSQMPVGKRDALDTVEEVVGSIHARGLLDRAYRDPNVLDHTVAEVMEEALPTVDETASLDETMAVLTSRAPAVLVCSGQRLTGVVTRTDVLDYLMGST